MFRIYPKPNLPDHTLVENKAEIYFDFNEPIITNTVSNTLLAVLPTVDTSLVVVQTCEASYQLNGRLYERSGLYYQHLDNQLGCDSVVALSLSVAPFNTETYVSGDSIWAASQNASSYQWIDCSTNQPINGANAPYFIPPSTGFYAVQIEGGACNKTSECTSFWSVGIEDLPSLILDYYPNPTKGQVEIVLGQKVNNIEIRIVNQLGQEVSRQTFRQKDQLKLDLPKVAGIYFLHLNLDGKAESIKVLKL
ncbi:MAG: T9SS type A sorting domain-containing protein [Bacteroidota bacterium]